MPATYTQGQLLPNGATVTAVTFVTLADGTTIETMEATYPNGATDHTVITTPGPNTPAANQQTLTSRANAALVNNATFLALVTPTNAQVVAQVNALTRECSALIRLLLGQFDTTAGT